MASTIGILVFSFFSVAFLVHYIEEILKKKMLFKVKRGVNSNAKLRKINDEAMKETSVIVRKYYPSKYKQSFSRSRFY